MIPRVVVHDSSGSVIGALFEWIPLPTSAATVEVLACRRALLFVKELSIFKCSLEGDAEVIIKALLAGDTNHPAYEHVINDAFVLADRFLFCSFSHVKRLCNQLPIF